MDETFRECPDCGSVQAFVQPHPGAGQCPDSPDGSCPEWFCICCGTAMLVTVHPAADPARTGRHPVGVPEHLATVA